MKNLPKWASGLTSEVKVNFVEKNKFGVLDHEVTLPNGEKVYVPMRVCTNNDGSEIIFTLFRTPEMTDEKFAQDVKWVTKDLQKLKTLLEN